ncbi:MAG: hypothetical protein ACI9C9_000036, partial [Marivirga sp.]
MNNVSVLHLRKCFLVLTFLGGFFGFSIQSMAQTPGLIYKPAVGGALVLDPNGDGYTSVDQNGFIADDELESEIPFVPLPVFGGGEPDSDLGPGPSCGFTDFVKSADNETLYTYSDGVNLYFRFRLGGTAPNSKGYSILVDTDQKFGGTGANADPNFLAGNPGFEVEIVLRTNFGVGVYDVDGLASGTEIGSATVDRPYDDYAQKSIALTTICGDPDYFYDFYVSYADLAAVGITSATAVRFIGNTVINPKAALGNNGISDLGGIDDALGITDNLWGELIALMPPTSGDDLNSGNPILPRASCPGIDGPIAVGATTVTGTSSEADGATIEVFKDAVSVGTTTVTGGIWSITGLTALVATEEITATATVTAVKSTSIGNCNPVIVGSTCSESPVITGVPGGTKGLEGTSTEEGAAISIYIDEALTILWTGANTTDPNPGIVGVTGSTGLAGQWKIAGTAGGSFPTDVYYVVVQNTGECVSPPTIHCQGVASSAIPTISTSPIVSTNTSIAGTLGATPTGSSTINLFADGVDTGFFTTTSTTSWTITGISGLVVGQVVTVVATESGECPSESVGVAVQWQSLTPIISGSYCTSTTISTVSGISSETPGSTITLYTKGSAGVTTADTNSGSTTVAANGSWSVTGLSLLPGTFIASSAQDTGDLESNLSNEIEILSQTVDGSLAITSSPITAGDASISGTGTNGYVVRLYLDGTVVDGFSATVSGGTWTISGLDEASAGFDVLYAEAEATVTAQNGALCESAESASLTIACQPPTTQSFTPLTTITDCETEAITFQLGATENLVVYQLIDQSGTATGSAILGNGGALNISTGALNTSMTSISVKALRIGITCETIFGTTAINVNPLPTISLGTNPIVCQGETSTSLTYSATTNSPNEYSIDFDATAEGEGFVDFNNTILPASPITITVPGAAVGGTYNANLIVTNTSTGCSSTNQAITIQVVDNVVALGTISNPTTCGGTDGSIQLTRLLASTSYTVDYVDDGVATSTSLSSSPAGNILISGLNAGAYTNISVTYLGCVSNIISSTSLSDPGSPNIIYNTQSNPSTCSGTDGTISIMNLTGNTLYDISYFVDATPTSVIGVNSDAGGNLIINNLNEGSYTQISVVNPSGCKSNSLAGPFTLTDPAATSITLGTSPSVAQGSTTANLPYSSLTGGADQYSIDFNAAAEAEGFVDVSFASITASPISITVPAAAAQATYNATIIVNNSTTLCQSGSVGFTVTITAPADVTPPAAAISGQPAIVNDATPYNVTVDFGEVVTGFVSTEVVVGNGSVTGFTDNGDGTYTVEITPDGTGDITIDVAANVAQDAAGNNNTAATQVTTTFDNTAPAAAISGQPAIVNDATPYNVTVDFGEVVTGFVSTEVVVGNGSVTGFTDNGDGTYTVEITPDGTGDITIDVAANVAQDVGGNNNTAATLASTTFDNTAPAAAISGQPAIVNDATPYNVTVDFGEVVTGFVSTEVVVGNGSVTGFTDNGDGTYTVEITPDGIGDITIDVAANVAQDAAGNNNTAATQVTTTFDNTAPAAAISGQPAIVNDATPYNVTVDFGEVVTAFVSTEVVVGNGSVTGFTDNGDGTYTVGITPDGTGDITIDVAANVAQDAAGNNNTAATQVTTTFDNTAPAVPTVNALTTADGTPLLSGTAEIGSTVVVVINGVSFTTTADGSGNWSVDTGVATPTAGGPFTALADGDYDVTATSSDAAGNSTGDATTNEVTIDSTGPTAPTVDLLTTNDLSPIITGTNSLGASQPAGETLTVTVNGATYTVVPDASGNWSVDTGADTPTSGTLATFSDGVSYEVVATVTDGGSNSASDATTNELTIDTTAPAVPTAVSQTTNDTTPIITGTAEAGSTVTVAVGGATYTVTANGSGNWTIDTGTATPDSGTFSPNVNGSNEVAVTSSDAAGNSTADGTTGELIIDTTAPAIPTVNALTTTDGTPLLTGTAEIGSTVVVVINGVSFTTTADGSGNWSVGTGVATPTAGGPFTALADGDYDVTATSSDAAGNSTGDATTNEVTIDSTGPTAPTVDLLTTNDLSPIITGTNSLGASQPAGETLTVTVNGATYTVVPDASGNWSVDTRADTPTSGTLATFSDGVSYEVVATVTDGGSNSASDATTNELTIDTTAPAVPTVVSQTTNDTTPVITGTAEAGSTVTVAVGGATYTVTANGSGNWTIDIETATPDSGTFSPNVNGSNEVAVTSSDAAGNSTADGTTGELIIDTTAPSVPTVNALTTADGTPLLSGTAEAGSTVVVVINGVSFTTTADGSGNWSVDTGVATPTAGGPFTALADGDYDVTATSSDAAGNSTGDATTNEVTIDTSAPANPTVNNLISTDGLPTLTGTWDEVNATTLEVTVGGQTYILGTDTELTTDGAGNWTLDLSGLATALTDGDYDVVVSISDGTITVTDATINELVVNTAIDSEAVYTVNAALPTDSYSNGETVATVADTDGAIVSATLSTGILPAGTSLDPVTGAITVSDASLLVAGIYTFDITTTDAVGGVTVSTVTVEFTAPGSDIEAVYSVVGSNPVDSYSNGDGLGTVTDADGAITSAALANATNLPLGVSLDPVTGALTVSDASQLVAGLYSFDINTTDAKGGTNTQTVTLEFTTAGSDIEAVYAVNGAQPTDSYSNGEVVATVTDADGAITNAIINTGSLPAGMTMDPVTGKITVADASLLIAGSYTLQITTTDVDGGTTVHTITIELTAPGTDIEAVYTVVTAKNVDAYNNSNVLATVTDADGVITNAVVTAGSLPAGTAIAADGTITVVDASVLVAGSYTFDVTTTDINGEITVNSVTIVFLPLTDLDGDGVPDVIEDIDGDGDPTNDDTDGDGAPDYLDTDDDGDGIPTSEEDIDGDGNPTNDDTDGDGIPDYLDGDDDGDGIPTSEEDIDGDGDPTNDDTDGDGIPDYLDGDDDGDGVPTIDEDIDGDGDPTNDDTDGDGIPDYLDGDDDGDGIPTSEEDIDGDGDPTNDDTDGDGIPDYLDGDDDGDGVPTIDEDIDGD